MKLTKQNKHYITATLEDLIYRFYHLSTYVDYKCKIMIKNDKIFNDIDVVIDIIISYKQTTNTSTKYVVYRFRNNTLVQYQQYRINDNGIYDQLSFDIFDLRKVNIINDNIVEMFKNLEVAENE